MIGRAATGSSVTRPSASRSRRETIPAPVPASTMPSTPSSISASISTGFGST